MQQPKTSSRASVLRKLNTYEKGGDAESTDFPKIGFPKQGKPWSV
jgi:hypothetical protein